MRRLAHVLLLAGVALANVGCLASISSERTVRGSAKQAVVVENQIYIVDVHHGSVCRIAPEAVTNAMTVVELETEEDED